LIKPQNFMFWIYELKMFLCLNDESFLKYIIYPSISKDCFIFLAQTKQAKSLQDSLLRIYKIQARKSFQIGLSQDLICKLRVFRP